MNSKLTSKLTVDGQEDDYLLLDHHIEIDNELEQEGTFYSEVNLCHLEDAHLFPRDPELSRFSEYEDFIN